MSDVDIFELMSQNVTVKYENSKYVLYRFVIFSPNIGIIRYWDNDEKKKKYDASHLMNFPIAGTSR